MRQEDSSRAWRVRDRVPGMEALILLLAAAIAHTLAFNRDSILWFVKGNPGQALALGALQTVMFWGLSLTLSLQAWLMGLVLPLLALVSCIVSYFVSTFEIRAFGPNTVALAWETNWEEAAGFLSRELLIQAGITVVASVLLVLVSIRSLKRFPRKRRLLLIGGCLALCAVPHLLTKLPMGLPFEALAHSASYLVEKKRLEQLMERRAELSLPPAQSSDEEMLVVLILGESARADHLQINGYPRPTTPKALELGLVSFRDVTSCGTTTRTAVPCMLTRASQGDPSLAVRETSLISVFKAAGFQTAWISNQSFLGKANTVVSAIAKEAHTIHYNYPQADNVLMSFTDQELLEPLEQALASGSGKTLIVLHTVGSHWLYDHHYPDEFRVFRPVCARRSPKSCTLEEIINSYDNSILHTDHFISQVIERVKHSKAMVWYVSDHGESLGEEGRWGHGQAEEIPEQRKVPMLVWASPRYMETHGGSWRNLLARGKMPLSHDNLFHSLIDCAGVRSEVVDRHLSLCQETSEESQGSK